MNQVLERTKRAMPIDKSYYHRLTSERDLSHFPIVYSIMELVGVRC